MYNSIQAPNRRDKQRQRERQTDGRTDTPTTCTKGYGIRYIIYFIYLYINYMSLSSIIVYFEQAQSKAYDYNPNDNDALSRHFLPE